jgi:CubicO group peptidase (beta-lactamase class C family)
VLAPRHPRSDQPSSRRWMYAPTAALDNVLMIKRLASLAMIAPLALTGAACGSNKPTARPVPPQSTASSSSSTDSVRPSSAATTPAPAALTTSVTNTPPTSVNDADAKAITDIRARFAKVGPNDPGCTIAVSRNGKLVFSEAYGAKRLNPSEPMTTGTVVDIGSTSKQFTATAILLLVQRGKVDLDATLAMYLPGVAPWASAVTVRQMMHHQSGIPDYIDLLGQKGFETTGRSTDADALTALAETTALNSAPGSTFEYSNSNYFLLGQVVLKVAGIDLGRFLAKEVFTPLSLAMRMDPRTPIASKATSYQGSGADRIVADSAWEQLGDGGIQTTSVELVKWASQYWAPTIGGPAINTLRLDQAASSAELGGRYGAGILETNPDGVGRVLSHSGGWGGFVTFFAVVPDRKLAVSGTCSSPETVESLNLTSDIDLLRPWL